MAELIKLFNTRKLDDDEVEKLENNFTYHPPFSDQPSKYEFIRGEAKHLAEVFSKLAPKSRELSLALTNLEQAVFWVNAAIARNETEDKNGT